MLQPARLVIIVIISLAMAGCLGPFGQDPGNLMLRVYNGTPSDATIQVGFSMEEELVYNETLPLPGYNGTRGGLPPSGLVTVDLKAGRYSLWLMIDNRPCTPVPADQLPADWDGTVGSINHIIGGIWSVTISPDLTCKIGRESSP